MSQPDQTERRLDGWKAIAGYFRRDRTTVMRWARERDLPVHRLPGGKQGSVFAYEHELASWAGRAEQRDLDSPADQPPPQVPAASDPPPPNAVPSSVAPSPAARGGKRLFVGASVVIAIGALVVATVMLTDMLAPGPSPIERAAALPHNKTVTNDYVAARDL